MAAQTAAATGRRVDQMEWIIVAGFSLMIIWLVGV
jgi:hypothetical protein